MDDWKSNSRMTLHKEIIFLKNHIDILRKHAIENAPNESCAILFGKNENERFITKEVFLTTSEKPSPISFKILAAELLLAYKKAEEEDLEMAIFHSHPHSEAYPSVTDLENMRWNPYPWVIFSNVGDEFKGYILESIVVPVLVRVL
jgi:[CysO sulfur-carrier protein]-S-L-cysteine hydrolase